MCKNTLLYCLFVRTLVRVFKPTHKVVPDWEHWPYPKGTSWCSSFLDWGMFFLSVLMTYFCYPVSQGTVGTNFHRVSRKAWMQAQFQGTPESVPMDTLLSHLASLSVGTCWMGSSQVRLPRPSLGAFACYLRTWWVSLKPQPDYQKEKIWVPAMRPCAVLFPMVWKEESWCGTPGFRLSAPTLRHCSGGLRTL